MSALPAVFLPYQQELMASVSAYAVTVAEKSRRTGYSWAAAAIAATKAAAMKSAGGSDVFYMGYEKDMTREFIDYVAMWAKAIGEAAATVQEFVFNDPDRPEKDIKAFRVEFASGYEVVALPNVARALRGKQGLVILDEVAFMDNLGAVLKAALAHLMWGGKVLILSTHHGEENEFNALIQDIRAGKKPYHLLRCTLDDALAQGLYKQICFTLGEEWSQEKEDLWRANLVAFYGDDADEELFVIPSEGGGTAIPRVLIEKRMTSPGPVMRWGCDNEFVHLPKHIREAECRDWCERELGPILAALDPTIPTCFGEDFARSGDLTAILVLQLLRNMTRRCPFIVELRNVPFEQQQQILFYIVDRLPLMRAGKLDAGGNGSFLAEVAMQRYGESRIEQVKFTEEWYRENMPKMKAAFEDGSIELPKDRDVLDDFALLRYVRGVIRVPERVLGSDGKGRHGDTAIAGALAWAASLSDFQEYGYQGAPPPEKKNAMPVNADDWGNDDDRNAAGLGGFLADLRGNMLGSQQGGAL